MRGITYMANIKQIAELSGVSVTTVSRVLNNHPYVSQEKREAVMQVVEQLDYSQNFNAVHLVKGRTQMIGILLPCMDMPFFSSFMTGLADEALKHKYNLVFFQTDYNEEEELRALHMLKRRQIDGLIIVSKDLSWDTIEEYAHYGPIVSLEHAGNRPITSISFDYYGSYSYAMRYLIDKGHRHIGISVCREYSYNSSIRLQAYMDALRDVGVTPQEDWMFYRSSNIQHGAEVLQRWIAMDNRPTAIIASGDEVAAGIILEGRKRDIYVPEHLSLISCENFPMAAVIGVTSIDYRNEEAGAAMFKACYTRIMQPEAMPEQHIMRFEFVERSSVASLI